MPKLKDPLKEKIVDACLQGLVEMGSSYDDIEVRTISNLEISVRWRLAAGPRRFIVKVSEQY